MAMKKNIACIILAAGKGVRMKSATPKVLHRICGRPMLSYCLDLAKDLKFAKTVLVLGHGAAEVRKIVDKDTKTVIQRRLLGTADAVKQALSALKNFKGSVLILYGDMPLLKPESLKKLLEFHVSNDLDAAVLSAEIDKPSGYGRILRDKYSAISGIVEEKDANDFEKENKEINTGIVIFKTQGLKKILKYIRANNRKKEYYLTDAVGLFYQKGYLVDALKLSDFTDAQGVNSRVDLARVNKIMQRRINEKFMQDGVGIIDPESTFIDYGAKIGLDTVIYPFTVIERGVKIGKRCQVGPFAHLREGTTIADDVTAGNFLEIVRSNISANTLIKHFSYVGDSRVGKGVNIGAGCVTANFDGDKKNITTIKDKAFIGSDTILVAPVKIGRKAVVGAGSVVLKNSHVADGVSVAGVPARIIKNDKISLASRRK